MTTASENHKRSAYRFGRFAEFLSCWRLRLAGYRILHQGFQAAGGEIDIIARRGDVLAFIEVKGRESVAGAAYALGPAQRRRIERAATAYLARYPEFATASTRFDLMLLAHWRWPVHLKGAWMVGE